MAWVFMLIQAINFYDKIAQNPPVVKKSESPSFDADLNNE
jgi:hypothetical protein